MLKDSLYSRNDVYYRKAKADCFRARSAYKLLQIDEMFAIFKGVGRVIDLCAAPGSWSQVCSLKLKALAQQDPSVTRVVAVDLQEMAPIDHVAQLQGDITKRATVEQILARFGSQKADLIISDGAPDVTGMHDMDQYLQTQLLVAALNICLLALREEGNFVAKVFVGTDKSFLFCQFKAFFDAVYFFKPDSSRESSA